MASSFGKKLGLYEQHLGPEALSVRLKRLAGSVEIVGSCDLETLTATLRHLDAEVSRLGAVARSKEEDARKDTSAAQRYAAAIARKQDLLAVLASMYGPALNDQRRQIGSICRDSLVPINDGRGVLLWTTGIDHVELLASLVSPLRKRPNHYVVKHNPFNHITAIVQSATDWRAVHRTLVNLPASDWNPVFVTDHILGATATWPQVQEAFTDEYPYVTAATFQLIATRITHSVAQSRQRDLDIQRALLEYAPQVRSSIGALIR